MSDLIIIGYDSPSLADKARADLRRVAKDAVADVADAMVVAVDAGGRLRFNQMADLWAIDPPNAAVPGGGLWGLLAGLLFLNPRQGAMIGPGAAPVSGAMEAFGIDDEFLSDASGLLAPGRAAIFLLIRSTASGRMVQRLAAQGTAVMRTPLDHKAEDSLRLVFARAPAHGPATLGAFASG